jgi:hypothetical protein
VLGGVVVLVVVLGLALTPSSARAEWRVVNSLNDYGWFDAAGRDTGRRIPEATFSRMVNATVAAADEAVGTAIPGDIAASEAVAGTTTWDSLTNVATALKTDVMDTLIADGAWAGEASMPGVQLVALGAGSAYVGWQIGSKVADWLGINAGTGSDFGGSGVSVGNPASGTNQPLHLLPAGTDLSTRAAFLCNASPCTVNHYILSRPHWLVTWQFAAAQNDITVWDMPPGSGSCSQSVANRPNGGTWIEVGTSSAPQGTGCTVFDRGLGSTVSCTFCVHDRMYIIPARLQALPGPGQSQPAPINQTVSNTFTQPSEDTMKRNARTVLTSPSHDQWQRYFCSVNPDFCGGPVPPDAAGSTTIVIPVPVSDEAYSTYEARLRGAGLTGRITKLVLSETAANPSVSPNSVVTTFPAPGSAVDPASAVEVQVNPDTLPAEPPGGGAPGAPDLPGISVPSAATPCDVFPFGLPCWLVGQLGAFASVGATAPSFSVGMPAAVCSDGCDVDVDLDHPFGADLSGVMAIVRPVVLVMSFIGLMIWIAGFGLGGSTGGGGGSEE